MSGKSTWDKSAPTEVSSGAKARGHGRMIKRRREGDMGQVFTYIHTLKGRDLGIGQVDRATSDHDGPWTL